MIRRFLQQLKRVHDCMYCHGSFQTHRKPEDALKVHEPSCQWLILRYSAAGVAFIILSAITLFHYFLYLQMQVESFSNLLPMAQIEVPSEVWGTNHNFLPTTFILFFLRCRSWIDVVVLCCAVHRMLVTRCVVETIKFIKAIPSLSGIISVSSICNCHCTCLQYMSAADFWKRR